MDFDELKKETEQDSLLYKEWNCAGKVYKIRLQNGDVEGQAPIYDAVEKWLNATPTSREYPKFRADLIGAILNQVNSVRDEDVQKIAVESVAMELYKIWLGTA